MYEFEGKNPKIGSNCYVYDEATIIGDVIIGEECYVGPGAVIRGDYGTILIGDRTAVEENCTLHARPDEILKIGNDVTIGHGAIIHNCTLDDSCVIGMGAIVSDYARIGEWAVVGEGAVVKNKSIIEPGQIAVGIPAKPVAQVNDEYKKQWIHFKGIYVDLART
ncbi:MAG: gamma carbonic anhydrase family protein, partial [Thermoplasmata archaeon]|nr:gamma carbonic anhydrase family protein [Thermoplasmata archaeon]